MKVSVIVPAYNCEQYIEQCLDSILASRMEGLEIIVVNDGSKDSTREILDRYASEGKIVAIHQKNGGASRARNAGLEVASGEYIGFVDADDWVEADMFPRMHQAAAEQNADIVFCNIYRNESQKMRKYLDSGVYDRERIENVIFPQLICSIGEKKEKMTLRGSTCCKLFRRGLLQSYGIRYHEDLVYNEDGVFCIEATVRAERYVYMGDDYLYHNRVTPGSLTKRYIPELWKRQKRIVDYLNAVAAETQYDFSGQIAKKVFEVAVYCAENECKADNPHSDGEVRRAIKKIANYKELTDALLCTDWRVLPNIKVAYYWAFRLKMPALIIATARHRERQHQRRRKT